MRKHRILVCGGRTFGEVPRFTNVDHYAKAKAKADREAAGLMTYLDSIKAKCEIECIIDGGAKGADFLAHVWACVSDIDSEQYPADWNTHGKRAGFIRNGEMLELGKPTLVIAFPGGAGTRDMIRQAKAAGIPVLEVNV